MIKSLSDVEFGSVVFGYDQLIEVTNAMIE